MIKANRPARADWKEGMKKRQVGVSDMTLLTKITDEAINENLELRWKNGDIYVGYSSAKERCDANSCRVDVYWTCAYQCQSVQRFGHIYRRHIAIVQGKEPVGGMECQKQCAEGFTDVGSVGYTSCICNCRSFVSPYEQLQGESMYHYQW